MAKREIERMIERSLGKKTGPLDPSALATLVTRHAHCELDLGTGDGAYPYRRAGEKADTLLIGVDAARENLQDNAARALKKPARGGRPNLLYLIAGYEALAENLPEGLAHVADRITILFPWGSLLQAAVTGEPRLVSLLDRLAKPNAQLEITLNLHVFDSAPLAERLALPELDAAHVEGVMRPAYLAGGWTLDEITRHAPDQLPVHTSWGRRLALGSKRETLRLVMRHGRA